MVVDLVATDRMNHAPPLASVTNSRISKSSGDQSPQEAGACQLRVTALLPGAIVTFRGTPGGTTATGVPVPNTQALLPALFFARTRTR